MMNKRTTTIQAVYIGLPRCDKITGKKIEVILRPKDLTLTTENITATSNQQYNYSTFNDNIWNTAKAVFKVKNGKMVKELIAGNLCKNSKYSRKNRVPLIL